MIISPHNRRNFLSSIAILSAGTAFGSTIKHFSPVNTADDLQKKWTAFWKKAGGRVFYRSDLNNVNYTKATKGHYYENGEIIYFPKENILAQPTWIFWKNNLRKPADVVVILYENNHSFNKIITLNHYEIDALYRLSKKHDPEQLLLASFNNRKPIAGRSTGIIKTKTNIKKNGQIQDISYYKEKVLVFDDKIIHHT